MSPEVINARLRAIETECEIRIVFAVESGSRAWGFASPDSDYDVRAVFIRNPQQYLRINPPREELSFLDGDFDLSAWDLRKFLRLARGSNPTPFEWLQSPIVYSGWHKEMASLLVTLRDYSRRGHLLNHYRSLARGSWVAFDAEGVARLRKFCYVLRPLLAARWVVEREMMVPPMALEPLLVMLDGATAGLRTAVDHLVGLKMTVGEDHVERLPEIVIDYVRETLDYLDQQKFPNTPPSNSMDLDTFFWKSISGKW